MAPRKKKKNSKAALKPLLTAEGPSDAMELSLMWEGGEAHLMALTDNGDRVRFGEQQGTGEGGLTLRWNSPDAFSHVLQWDLAFKGTRAALKATATVNGSGGFEHKVESNSRKDRWKAAGTVED